MADKKISQLTSASTPLAGTEVAPIVQSSSTVKVALSVVKDWILSLANTFTAKQEILTAQNDSVTGGTFANPHLKLRDNATTNLTGTTVIAYAESDSDNYGWTAGVQRGGGGGSSSFIWRFHNNSAVGVQYGEFTPTGDLKNSTGNFIPATAAKGVNFTANTPAAGMTSQLLNWYEEGTWTPTQGAGLTVVGAFTSSGTYTRVGRVVTLSGRVQGATSVAVTAGGVITNAVPWQAGSTGTGAAVNGATNASAATILYGGSFNLYSVQAVAATTFIDFTITYMV